MFSGLQIWFSICCMLLSHTVFLWVYAAVLLSTAVQVMTFWPSPGLCLCAPFSAHCFTTVIFFPACQQCLLVLCTGCLQACLQHALVFSRSSCSPPTITILPLIQNTFWNRQLFLHCGGISLPAIRKDKTGVFFHLIKNETFDNWLLEETEQVLSFCYRGCWVLSWCYCTKFFQFFWWQVLMNSN